MTSKFDCSLQLVAGTIAGVTLILRPMNSGDETAVRTLHEELLADDFEFLFSHTNSSWDEILDRAERESAGVDLLPGRVRSDFLVAEADGEVVGRTSIRYELSEWLFNFGGHIGYAVGPRFRRRGYATEILRQSLDRLRQAGVDRALITCDETNVASQKTIEACGGKLENTVELDGTLRRRYWIDL